VTQEVAVACGVDQASRNHVISAGEWVFSLAQAKGCSLPLCLHTPGCCQAFYWDVGEPVPDGDGGASMPGRWT
jgi:hypothetical protein